MKARCEGALGEDKVLPALYFVWSAASSGRRHLGDAITHMHRSQRNDSEVVNNPSTSWAVIEVFDEYLDAEGDWDLPDILLSGEIDICSSLQADLTVIRDKSVNHLIEVAATAAGVFKLMLRGLNRL